MNVFCNLQTRLNKMTPNTTPILIHFSPQALALLKKLDKGNVTKAVNDAVIAQLGQGEEAAKAKLKILLALTDKE